MPPLFRTQLCSTFKGFRIQQKGTKWWPLEEYLRMPIASRFVVIGHVQLRMSFRRDISWWTQNPLNPFELNCFCGVPPSGLSPVLLNMSKDVIGCLPLNFALQVMPWLSGTSLHLSLLIIAQLSMSPPISCPALDTARMMDTGIGHLCHVMPSGQGVLKITSLRLA